MLGICKTYKSGEGFRNLFAKHRNLYKVLKCFIFGKKDIIFPEDMINEKVIYYSYTHKFDEGY